MIGFCRLCGREAELRLSHIMPELLYRPSYDEKHRATELIADQGRQRFLQKGHRERLLCDDCEGCVGGYEKYFADAWFRGGLRPERPKERIVHVAGLDYRLFKLFHLSVVWRAGVGLPSNLFAMCHWVRMPSESVTCCSMVTLVRGIVTHFGLC